MSTEKTTAIVLRVIEFSETSCIVTMLTREFGKVTALAKGARRPKSPFEAALDVLALVRIVFLHKSSDAMDLLTEAKLERRFRNRSSDLEWLYAAYYVVELLRNMTEEGDPHPELFDLAADTIGQIDGETMVVGAPMLSSTGKYNELNLCLLRFEVGLLKVLGHFPMLTQCVNCGRLRLAQNRVSFGLHAGGVLCRQCRAGHSNVVGVSPEAIEFLQDMNGTKNENSERRSPVVKEAKSDYATMLTVDRSAAVEVRRLMNKYLSHLMGFEPRLHKFLKKLGV